MDPTAHARSLYRAIMRELPQSARTSIKTSPSPLRSSIRKHFVNSPSASSSSSSPEALLARRQEMEQAIKYLKAQRTYVALLERYNPGMDMSEEDRVRLTARRVGMDMPEEWYGSGGTAGKFGGIKWEKKKE
ncbi:hypothetical protein LTR64_000617 [Lithohypha guttulata]|uniref:Uncharacterized protein n=1 Tax=Lithohypha guttulata TaxID=1690604 RepID=A0AAN7T2F8_9EURO|nr:hypothetical protein LTR05_003801 [Lithohypha guttulata]